jgi:Ca-activated chloride channel family protein
MAQISGGTYYNAQSTQQLNDIYGTIDTQMVAKPEKTEITSLFAGLSILVLLVGGIFSLSWFSRLP